MAFMRDLGGVITLSDVPQWVIQNFIRAAKNAGAQANEEQIKACCLALLRDWCQADRYHHDIRHLLDMLMRLDTLSSETSHPDYLRLACWFHGIVFSTSNQEVYTRNGGEDEIASAYLAQEKMQQLGMPEEAISAVQGLIISLKNRPHTQLTTKETGAFQAIDMDQVTLRDAHLGSLAVEPQKYKKYLAELRQEYSHIPLGHFLQGRIEIVRRLLARPQLFISPLAAQWENVARQNLSAELERLQAELKNAPDLSIPTGAENTTQPTTTTQLAAKEQTTPAPAPAPATRATQSKMPTVAAKQVAGNAEMEPSENPALPSTAPSTTPSTEPAKAIKTAANAAPTGSTASTASENTAESVERIEKAGRADKNTPAYIFEDVTSEEVVRAEAAAIKEAETPRSSMENLDDAFSPGLPKTTGSKLGSEAQKKINSPNESTVPTEGATPTEGAAPTKADTALIKENAVAEKDSTAEDKVKNPEAPANVHPASSLVDSADSPAEISTEPVHAMEEAPDY